MENELKPRDGGAVKGFPDTFFGPNDKKYLDRISKSHISLRGTDLYYFKKLDTPSRIDGNSPLTTNQTRGDFDPKSRSGTAALYGEPVIIGKRINAVTREITPSWNYAEPIKLRGVVIRPQQTDTADERGHIIILKAQLQLSRAMCDDVKLSPEIGDVVLLPNLLDSYYDVELLRRDDSRFGSTGFFIFYSLDLSKKSIFIPERKNLPGVPTSGAFSDTIKETKKVEDGLPPTIDGKP